MDVAESYRMAGRPRDAAAAFRDAFERLSSLGRDQTEKAGTLLNNWGLTLQLLGRPAEAETAFRRAVAISNAGEKADAVSPMLLNNLARALVELRRLDEAVSNAEHAYEKARRGGDDVAINQTLLVRTAAYRERGELDRAERTLDEVAPRIDRMYAPNHLAHVAVATERSMLAFARGDFPAAARHADDAVTIATASAQSGEALPRVLVRRANVRTRLGRAEEARADAARAVELERAYARGAAPSSRVGRAYAALGGALELAGKSDEARAAFASALENLEPTLGAAHADAVAARRALGYVPGQTGAGPVAKR
jgi:tetratricopeptide (TPR) repeat protein